MHSQCNPNEEQFLLLKSIKDHKQTPKAILKGDEYIIHNVWQEKDYSGVVAVHWMERWYNFLGMLIPSQGIPTCIAEYAIAAGIKNEPAFKWWTHFVFNTRDHIIAKVYSQYHKRTRKFGV